MKFIPFIILVIASIHCSDSKPETVQRSSQQPFQLLRDTAYEAVVSKKAGADVARVKQLSKFVSFKKDEYDGNTWVTPKSKPAYRNRNGIYCYFSKDADKVSNFRLAIQYFADDWLFIEGYRFVIDGETFRYSPMKVERDNGGGDIWEWSDEKVSLPAINIIQALVKAKSAKMRFEGAQYYKEKIITAAQIKAVKDVYDLYRAMGGTF